MDSIASNYTGTISKLSELTCEICDEHSGKYRCPRCSLVTCSLSCCQTHKSRDKCSGVRNRSAFVRRTEFDMDKLSSDIGLLEDAARITGAARKTMKSVDPMVHKEPLVLEANRRRVDLRLLAEWFPKRKENRTYCDIRARKMYWTVKWIVQYGEDEESSVEILKHRCLDNVPLIGHIQSLPSTPEIPASTKSTLTTAFAPALDASRIEALLLLDPAHSKPDRLRVSVDVQRKLGQILVGKLIVEYPTFLVKIRPPSVQAAVADPVKSKDDSDQLMENRDKEMDLPVGAELLQERGSGSTSVRLIDENKNA